MAYGCSTGPVHDTFRVVLLVARPLTLYGVRMFTQKAVLYVLLKSTRPSNAPRESTLTLLPKGALKENRTWLYSVPLPENR